jgi:hypothetical protein
VIELGTTAGRDRNVHQRVQANNQLKKLNALTVDESASAWPGSHMLYDEETLEHRAPRCKSVSYRFILVLSAAATLLLVLTYFSILLNVFVFADEYRQLRLFGSKSVLEAIGDYAYYGFRSMGRPLSAGTYVAYRALAGDGYTGLVWVRALSLALSAISFRPSRRSLDLPGKAAL